MKKIFNVSNIRLFLILGLVVFLYSFSSNRNNNRKIRKTNIEFIGNQQLFVTHETVNKLLIENKEIVLDIKKVALDLNSLENAINKHQLIKDSEVFVSIDGVLNAVVKQKTPVARYVKGFTSYYIDYDGDEMPLSEIHTARVPLISGDIINVSSDSFKKLLQHIYNDEFLKKNIIGVEILPSGGLVLKSRDFDYNIDFGKIYQIEEKFRNYKAFFHKAIQDKTLSNYKIINLKFSQQVVCTK